MKFRLVGGIGWLELWTGPRVGVRKSLVSGAPKGTAHRARLPLWVTSGSPAWASECPLLGAKRTLPLWKRPALWSDYFFGLVGFLVLRGALTFGPGFRPASWTRACLKMYLARGGRPR